MRYDTTKSEARYNAAKAKANEDLANFVKTDHWANAQKQRRLEAEAKGYICRFCANRKTKDDDRTAADRIAECEACEKECRMGGNSLNWDFLDA